VKALILVFNVRRTWIFGPDYDLIYSARNAKCRRISCVRFTPVSMELHLTLKPFIPDMIPAVPDVDAMLKVAFLFS